MPVAALGLEGEIVADMARAGLRRIGDLAMRPRAPISARFGAEVLARLDALNGLARDAISPRFAAPDFCAERRFASPIAHVDAVDGDARQTRRRSRRAAGAPGQGRAAAGAQPLPRRWRRAPHRVGAGRPLNEARAIARLFVERLAGGAEEEIDAGFGVDLMRLSCLVAEPLEPSQSELERAFEAERARKLADLLDRLSARLGPRRRDAAEARRCAYSRTRRRRRPCDSRARCARGVEGLSARSLAEAPSRPLRLFERPEPIETIAEVPDGPPMRFRWRRVMHEVAAIEGPERIARPGGAARTRRPATISAPRTAGRRYWLYREGLWGRETAGEMVPARGVRVRKPFSRLREKVAGRSERVFQKGDDVMRDDIPRSAKSRARDMRQTLTEAERKLWYALRDRRMQSIKFRRQAPIGPYIADFSVCEHRLVVEADGSQHCGRARDNARDAWFARNGYRVLRFWNHEILTAQESVLATIAAECGLPW